MAATDRDILFVTLSDISGSSGNSIATKEIVKAFARTDGITLDVVCPEPVDTVPNVIAENVRAIHFLPSRNDPSITRRVLEQGQLVAKMNETISQWRPDIVVARMNPTLLMPPLLAERYGIPYVLLARGNSYKNLRYSPLLKGIFWVNARLADRVYAAYQEVKEDADAARTSEQPETQVFANAVDPDLFSKRSITDAREEIDVGFDEDDFVVGSVSTLKPYHQLDELIRAIGNLYDETDAKLLVVGDGPERDRLEALVAEEGLEDRVVFTGFVPHEDVETYIASADVLYGANAAGNAGNPIKCYEYLACGRPIIATATPEFEFVEERNLGRTIEETDEASITDAIADLYETREADRREMGRQGREYVLKNHTWDALARQVLDDLS